MARDTGKPWLTRCLTFADCRLQTTDYRLHTVDLRPKIISSLTAGRKSLRPQSLIRQKSLSYRGINADVIVYIFAHLHATFEHRRKLVAAAASEPETNERGSSLISRRLHYRGLQSLFLSKRKGLWLCTSGRFRMRSCMPQGIVVMREWEDLGYAAYQSHV